MTLSRRVREIHLTVPLTISRSTTTDRHAVEVTLDDGVFTGRGEVVTSPFALIPLKEIHDQLDAWGTAGRKPLHPAVAAALDSAQVELISHRQDAPVFRTLGLDDPGPVGLCHTIGINTPDETRRLARDASTFSVLKVKASGAVADDIERLHVVADAVPTAELLVDPNQAWTVASATEILVACSSLPIVALEQPLPVDADPADLARVRSTAPCPLVADESVYHVGDLNGLAGVFDAINIKLPHCGGVRPALDLARRAIDLDLEIMLGCLASTSLSIAPAAHLASLARWCDLDGHLLLQDDPYRGLGGHDGSLRLDSRAPGWGLEEVPCAQ